MPGLVFANYYTPNPISIDNKYPTVDYYAAFNTPEGDGGKHTAYGGAMRDRPIGRNPKPGNWKLDDLRDEIAQAKKVGIDGFVLNLLGVDAPEGQAAQNLMVAASEGAQPFPIMLQADIYIPAQTGVTPDPNALADTFAVLADYPATYRLPDGRLVIQPYAPERMGKAWWQQVNNRLTTVHGETIAFFPCFLNFTANYQDWADISYGMSAWGERNPLGVANTAARAATVHGLGKAWMQPVGVQDVRPKTSTWQESHNTQTLRDAMNGAITGNAEYVQLTVWNDYSENAVFAPSKNHGWTFLDVLAQYITKYKTGAMPAVTEDKIHVSHRTHFASATPTYPQTALANIRPSSTPARDAVEIISYLTAPAQITSVVGGVAETYTASAGEHIHTRALALGPVRVSASRGGVKFADVPELGPVTATPYVQDLTYHAASFSTLGGNTKLGELVSDLVQRIQLRRDTAAQWNTFNPILARGEVGLVTDVYPMRLKMGDGVASWNDLDYYSDQTADMELPPFGEFTTGINNPDALTITATSGQLILSYFVAKRTEECGQVRVWSGGTAGGDATLNRVGVYEVAPDGALTLLAATAHDAALYKSTGTAYLRSLTTPFLKRKGREYAVGLLTVTTAATPTFVGLNPPLRMSVSGKRRAGQILNLNDLPASVPANGVNLESTRMPTVQVLP